MSCQSFLILLFLVVVFFFLFLLFHSVRHIIGSSTKPPELCGCGGVKHMLQRRNEMYCFSLGAVCLCVVPFFLFDLTPLSRRGETDSDVSNAIKWLYLLQLLLFREVSGLFFYFHTKKKQRRNEQKHIACIHIK